MLLTTLVQQAADLPGVDQVTLGVATTQPAAISLYRSLGFERFGYEPAAIRVGGIDIDEELMILRLDELRRARRPARG
jgi:ribosomal protein S18 acetylase RimI-like enzyme